MSGWIKLEKELREDIRVRRMARQLSCNAPALQGSLAVTVVLGGLAQLWMHADSFARDDDTLEITADEIDELTGVEGFAKLLPADWLEVLDAKCVKLPGFQAHNGSQAKRRALTAKRVSAHRETLKRNEVTTSENSVTQVRYQTRPRPDQTRPDQSKSTSAAAPPAEFADFKAMFPRRAGSQPWDAALKAIRARLAEGATWGEILEGTRRYAEYIRATGKERTEYVLQAATFCGPTKRYRESWELPATRAETRLNGNLSAAEEFMRRTEGT